MVRLSENARTVLFRRDYLKRDASGKVVETPEAMFHRVANAVAAASGAYGEDVARDAHAFYRMMTRFEFLPNSPTLMHAGRNGANQLSACFVLPVDDNLESIFKTLHDAALVLRTGGGVGFAFSRLRSRGSLVATTGGVASGPVSYMDLFDHMAQVINEGASRRVAMMGILRVDHPDIEEFITAKGNGKRLRNFNISVGMSDQFMEALKRDTNYALVDPHTQKVVREVSAKAVFDLISEQAWKVADPGLVFLDRMNAACPIRHLGEIEATNPCGEQPLLPYQSCNLGSINLGKFVNGPSTAWTRTESRRAQDDKRDVESLSRLSSKEMRKVDSSVDWERLEKVVQLGVKFLDNVIDVCDFPLPEIDEMSKKTRKIGLGVMGFADLLYLLGIPYDSEEGVALGERLAEFIERVAREESVRLGQSRGSFPAFQGSRWEAQGFPAMRNSTITTIAPTGTISILASCSSGIEPVFALAFTRKNILDIGKTAMVEFNRAFRRALGMVVPKQKRRAILSEVAQSGTCRSTPSVPPALARVFVTSHDISWQWHIRMQAAWQRHIDSAVSKTINMPETVEASDVREAYLKAYDTGCMGITIYRDKSRSAQVLNLGYLEEGEVSIEPSVKEPVVVGNGGSEDHGTAVPGHQHISVVVDGDSGICPECRTPMVFQDGCAVCPNCSYSYCSSS